jgi:hypothetical protein
MKKALPVCVVCKNVYKGALNAEQWVSLCLKIDATKIKRHESTFMRSALLPSGDGVWDLIRTSLRRILIQNFYQRDRAGSNRQRPPESQSAFHAATQGTDSWKRK